MWYELRYMIAGEECVERGPLTAGGVSSVMISLCNRLARRRVDANLLTYVEVSTYQAQTGDDSPDATPLAA